MPIIILALEQNRTSDHSLANYLKSRVFTLIASKCR